MSDIKYSCLLMVILLIIFGLVSCKKVSEQSTILVGEERSSVTRLPVPIKQTHLSDIFVVTWFEQPFPGHYDRLALRSDGSVEHWQIYVNWAAHGVGFGQLDKDQQEEVGALLKTMTETHSVKPLEGLRTITLNFLWESENYVVQFSESSCTNEFQNLLKIIGTDFGWNQKNLGESRNPCQRSDEHQKLLQETATPASPPFPLLDFPDPQRPVQETPRLFCITWFEQPFDGIYYKLSAFADNSVMYWRMTDNDSHEVARGELTERERREVQTILNLITGIEPVEEPVGTMIITLSFLWKADYHLLTIGSSDCPDNLRRLFEVADTVFKRESQDFEWVQSPCQKNP